MSLQYHDDGTSEDGDLGIMDQLSILLNPECQSHFYKRHHTPNPTTDLHVGSKSSFHNQTIGEIFKFYNGSLYSSTTSGTTQSDTNTFTPPISFQHNNSTDGSTEEYATTNMAVEDVLFHLANVLFLISYLAPSTRFGQVWLHSGLCIGFLIFATWAWNIVCAPEVFVWYFAFTVLNVGQLLYILYQVMDIFMKIPFAKCWQVYHNQ